MDEDLKEFLTQMEARMEARIAEQMDKKFAAFEARIDDKFTAFSQHLLHEMSVRIGELKEHNNSIDERLKLQAGLIQGGARSMARFTAFSENAEERWVDLTRRVGDLERKVDELGGKNAA